MRCILGSAPFQGGPVFSCVVPGENQKHQDLVKALGYWKTCFKLEKMAEKKAQWSERKMHFFLEFIVSLSGAMYFGLKCTISSWSTFFLCGAAKTKGTRTSLRLPAIGKHALSCRKWRKSGRNGAREKSTISPSSE